MSPIKQEYNSSVERHMLAKFLHRNYKEKHKFKTREVHGKCSLQNLESKTGL